MYSDNEDLRVDRCYCGGNPQVESRYGSFFVICKECGCSGSAYPTQKQAIRSWNKKNRRIKGESEK